MRMWAYGQHHTFLTPVRKKDHHDEERHSAAAQNSHER